MQADCRRLIFRPSLKIRLVPLVNLASIANTIVVTMLLLGNSYTSVSQTKNSQHTRIEDARFIKLGGLEQWVTIRGDNSEAPVLLLLHGGPGDVQSPLVDVYAAYEKDFILAQWDQRGSGKTYGKYKEQTPNLTLSQLVNDGIELAEYLKNRFKRKGIIVLGHSLGTAIATEMVTKRADLFLACVGTGQIASWAESVQWQFDFLKSKATMTNDEKALSELTKIGTPDPLNTKQYFSFTKPLRKYLNNSDASWLEGLRGVFEKFPKHEFEDIEGGMILSGRVLLQFQVQENLSTSALVFKVPYYVIQGREDLFTPTEPVIRYFEKVNAPKKQLVILEDAGHFALATHQQQFIEAMRKVISR